MTVSGTADGAQGTRRASPEMVFLGAALAGAAVSVALGVYARQHTPSGEALFTLGFSGTLNMKVWLATIALVLAVIQVLLAAWMYGKLGKQTAPAWVGPTHRLVGMTAFLVLLPVAYHCLWALGFRSNVGGRVVAHSLLGCAFFGAFTLKVLCVRSHRMPGWALQVAGGLLFVILVALWLTSSLWFFRTVGFPEF